MRGEGGSLVDESSTAAQGLSFPSPLHSVCTCILFLILEEDGAPSVWDPAEEKEDMTPLDWCVLWDHEDTM